MSFTLDKQTQEALGIMDKNRPHSLFAMFSQVQTAGGEKLLESMFLHPLTDPVAINHRSNTFAWFEKNVQSLPFDRTSLEAMTKYLEAEPDGNWFITAIIHLWQLILGWMLKGPGYASKKSGIITTIAILRSCYDFIGGLARQVPVDQPIEQIQRAMEILSNKRLSWVCTAPRGEKPSCFALFRYDRRFRHTLRQELAFLTEIIYWLDVHITVGRVAKERGLSYAVAFPKQENRLTIGGLFHPAIQGAVGNSFSLDQRFNILLIIGGNMTGKTTLIKAFGSAVYLAHMGFPVPAVDMGFSVKDGLFACINRSDDSDRGYSHFYSEVLRMKEIAKAVAGAKDLVILFDDLFKGGGVKDAYDATVAVTSAFAAYHNCFYMISTHIVETARALETQLPNILCLSLQVLIEGALPRYTYELQPGIAESKTAMIFLEKEGLLDLLDR